MNRRRWLLGGAGAAAALAGLAWQRGGDRATGAPAPASLWQSSFTRPEGGELALASLRGAPLVLNFWATWCAPCVKEMPELDRFQREFSAQGWHVVGLAVDNPTAVREFLARTRVGYAIGLAGFDGSTLSRQLGNENGGLPFTAMLNRRGEIVHRRLGQTSLTELSGWARAIQAARRAGTSGFA